MNDYDDKLKAEIQSWKRIYEIEIESLQEEIDNLKSYKEYKTDMSTLVLKLSERIVNLEAINELSVKIEKNYGVEIKKLQERIKELDKETEYFRGKGLSNPYSKEIEKRDELLDQAFHIIMKGGSALDWLKDYEELKK